MSMKDGHSLERFQEKMHILIGVLGASHTIKLSMLETWHTAKSNNV